MWESLGVKEPPWDGGVSASMGHETCRLVVNGLLSTALGRLAQACRDLMGKRCATGQSVTVTYC